jgi:hypothetical protein
MFLFDFNLFDPLLIGISRLDANLERRSIGVGGQRVTSLIMLGSARNASRVSSRGDLML